nr:MAG TPA: hypothetical protein [Caudoviricetes sp.]
MRYPLYNKSSLNLLNKMFHYVSIVRRLYLHPCIQQGVHHFHLREFHPLT